MKILFIYPECENLGIEYLSAALKECSHEVDLIFDPMLFNTYFLNVKSLARLFNFKKFILNDIKRIQPELVCFSVFSDFNGWACALAEEIKKVCNAPIIFGGIHPTSTPETVIQNKFVDFVCVGEGEEALVELANAIETGQSTNGIANIWSKEEGFVHKNPLRPLIKDLDKLTFPDKELFKNEYPFSSNGIYTIMASRGCVNACTYCYNSYLRELYKDKGEYLRRRSSENVLSELRIAKDKWHIKRVSFFDDLFIYDFEWLKHFLYQYKNEINLPYFCHIHPQYITPGVVALLESTGCSSAAMGIQTFNEQIRKNILHRYESNQCIINAIEAFKGSKIFLYTNIIIGLPNQDETVIVDDVHYSNIYKADMASSNWLRYYPNVKLISISKGLGILTTAEEDAISLSMEYQPYSAKGNTYHKCGAKLRTLFSVCQIVPRPVMSFILRYKIYRFFPEFNWRFFITMLILLHRKLFLRKINPFSFMSISEVLRYYVHYLRKYFKNTLTLSK